MRIPSIRPGRLEWAICRGGLSGLLYSLLLTSCAGTVPYTTAPEYETTQIQGTDLWVVWPSRELVQRLDYFEHLRSEPRQAAVVYSSDTASQDGDPFVVYDDDPEAFIVVSDVPQAIYTFSPRYPSDAEVAGTEGTVWIRSLVLTDGVVGEARVARSSGINPGFERAALEAAMLYTYSPARYQDEKVDCWVTYPVQFRLKKP